MKSNSNTNITNFSVDPITQQITSLEVNGEVVETGGADLDENKTATIDVSTYTEPVEITPTSGKDGMAKATITLSNIPVGSDVEIYGLASGSSQPSWTNVNGIAFMAPDKTQGGFALMDGSGGWTKNTATWNDDFTKIVVSSFSYNYALIDSSFFG